MSEGLKERCLLPLESNPDVMNKFLENLGVSAKWGVSDVFSLDETDLDILPKPILAFLLLFPTGEKDEEYYKKTEKGACDIPDSNKVFFMKQTMRNACGTMALIHAVANNTDVMVLADGSPLQKFFANAQGLTPEEKGKLLEEGEEVKRAHEASSLEGQSEVPRRDDDVFLHFIALVKVGSNLYELDGRKSGPVCHGATSEAAFVKDACRVCREFMDRDSENLRFTVLALGPRG